MLEGADETEVGVGQSLRRVDEAVVKKSVRAVGLLTHMTIPFDLRRSFVRKGLYKMAESS
jgi:hypothetical protein